MGSAHALTLRQIIERHGATTAVDTAPARTLDDHARHVSTHGSTPVAKGDRARGSIRAVRSRQRRHFPEKTVGAVISGGADVDQAPPFVNAGARCGESRLGLRLARGKIVEDESYVVAVEIDLEHPVDRFAEGGEFVERGLEQTLLQDPVDGGD
jgi:hypothetical protein